MLYFPKMLLWWYHINLQPMAIQGRQCLLRSRCLWGMCTFLHATDRPVLRLGDDLRLAALNAGVTCLDSYSELASWNLQKKRLNFKLRPKWQLFSIWKMFIQSFFLVCSRTQTLVVIYDAFSKIYKAKDPLKVPVVSLYPRHPFAHLVYDLQFTDENCRNHKTLSEESMLGKIAQLALNCPGSNVLQRFFQRFCLFLAMHWDTISKSPTDVVEAD